MTDNDPYRLLTRTEVAEHLRCTVNFVSQLTRSGALYSIRVGKRVMVPRANLEAFIRGEPVLLQHDEHGTPPLFGADDYPDQDCSMLQARAEHNRKLAEMAAKTPPVVCANADDYC